MRITAEPRSDQWNADDFIGGPRTFTIAGVKHGTAEQKYDVELVEGEGRVWRPPLTMLRLLMAAWGDETAVWVGRRVTLYRDETVRFGPDAVGGIRVSHMSDLPGGKRFSTKVTEKRGKRATITVEPLTEAAPQPLPRALPTPEDIAAAFDRDVLQAMWRQFPDGHPARKAIEARVAELDAVPADNEPDPTFPSGDAA